MGMKPREPCRPVFTKLYIWTLASQYILSLMTFMINNLEYFTFNYTIHERTTRHGRNLHILKSHLTMKQNGFHCMSIKILTVCQII
jgi:hypothetical protein